MTGPGILCCGNIVCDILVQPVEELNWSEPTSFVHTIEQRCGGSGASTARTLGILGIPVRLLSVVGSDDQARFVLEVICRSSVDISHVTRESGPTACTVALVNRFGDRKFFHRPGTAARAFDRAIEFDPDLRAGMSHFHLCGVFVMRALRKQAPELLKRAHAAGMTTSFDTNWDPHQAWISTLEPCLPNLDLLFMNESEAARITGHTEPLQMAHWAIRRGVPVCVLKLGASGCAIYTNDTEILCPAFEVDVRDTTGAGDCFVGGFLAARQRGVSLADAGQFANAVAAMSVQHVGAVEGVLGTAETEAWMRQTPLRKVMAGV